MSEKKHAELKAIFWREFSNYFNTPIGYIFLGIFVIVTNFLFFYINNFWNIGIATLDGFFNWIRITYIFFIPAITMRLWAEEKKSGTMEVLFTLPVTDGQAILGKFLSAVAFLAVSLAATFVLPLTLEYVSDPDWMLIIGGYFGSLLLGSSYIAMGLFISWKSGDQIVAFLVGMLACLFFFLLGYQPVLQFFGPFKKILAYLSVSWHFDSLSRGLFDTRDFLYFATFILFFLHLNARSIEKWRGEQEDLKKEVA
ncbi:MAG: gliding motility ABC transporter [Candidatus Hydrogenedentota bacterium]|nr:MAG: gliding motility ABC transporter [Candidatus Hydrogenedentota bacterium]